jgi:hypothetical protein
LSVLVDFNKPDSNPIELDHRCSRLIEYRVGAHKAMIGLPAPRERLMAIRGLIAGQTVRGPYHFLWDGNKRMQRAKTGPHFQPLRRAAWTCG